MTLRTHATRRRLSALASTGLVAGALAVPSLAGASSPAVGATPATAPRCQLGNGISHVINIVFDNVHFGRDNPNVPSDLEQMPHLMHFLRSNGTILSNTHTPLIAHTADDSLSIYTGLYGDRHGQPLTNSYKTYNPDGTTDPAASFAYWTSPVADTASTPTAGHDTSPSMVYSDTVPASGAPDRITPAPWVPFTRAGCDVGDFSTANMVAENARVDIPTLFGAGSPEDQQLNADPDSFKDAEVADYVGVAVHCAQGSAVCADAKAVKYGETAPTPSAVPDRLPTEPGGYPDHQGLFGARYVAPQLGAGTPDLIRHGYPVTNAAGNLVDLDGNQINGAFLTNHPGFPGFSPTASQTLAYVADMQEAGIPVTYGYVSDLHDKKPGQLGCTSPGNALGPGDPCYLANAKAYDSAFATFFDRLRQDGITPANTLFVISAEENDQFAGANVGRAVEPTPPGCDGVTTPCHYSAGQLGELQANLVPLLASTASKATPFDLEPQGASLYVHGQPAADDPALRQLERDTASLSDHNAYSGVDEHIVKYQAGAVEERILHMRTADPLRLPSYTMFPVPDYYFGTGKPTDPPVTINSAYAWNHGYYSPNIDVTWSSFVGPGVARLGVDGPAPGQSNESHDPNSTHTVPEASSTGTWVEEVDLRPTMLWLTGLTDDYQSDGRVVSQVLSSPTRALTRAASLAAAYQQVNSSVGPLATATLQAESAALASGGPGHDAAFRRMQAALTRLADHRDRVATRMKQALAEAAAGHVLPPGTTTSLVAQGRNLMREVRRLPGQ